MPAPLGRMGCPHRLFPGDIFVTKLVKINKKKTKFLSPVVPTLSPVLVQSCGAGKGTDGAGPRGERGVE